MLLYQSIFYKILPIYTLQLDREVLSDLAKQVEDQPGSGHVPMCHNVPMPGELCLCVLGHKMAAAAISNLHTKWPYCSAMDKPKFMGRPRTTYSRKLGRQGSTLRVVRSSNPT